MCAIILAGSDFNETAVVRVCIPPLAPSIVVKVPHEQVLDDLQCEDDEGFIVLLKLEEGQSLDQPVTLTQQTLLVTIQDNDAPGECLIQ